MNFLKILNLTIFDYIVISIISYSVISGFIRGFIKAVTSFFYWIISFIGSYFLYYPIVSLIEKEIHSAIISKVSASILSYVICLCILSFLSSKIISVTSGIRDGAVDKSLGLAFGLFRGALVSCVVFQITILLSGFVLNSEDDSYRDKNSKVMPIAVKTASTYQLLSQGSDIIMMVLPQKLIKQELSDMLDVVLAAESIAESSAKKNEPKKPKEEKINIKTGPQQDSPNLEDLDTETLMKGLEDMKSPELNESLKDISNMMDKLDDINSKEKF